jgi:hypothetical protein
MLIDSVLSVFLRFLVLNTSNICSVRPGCHTLCIGCLRGERLESGGIVTGFLLGGPVSHVFRSQNSAQRHALSNDESTVLE